ncbi:hypothetical protein BJ138DRAFT_1096948, partial [Hygrophoropsis aurantiaca]
MTLSRSWERGTAAEALTELSWPHLSVFDKSSIPPPNGPNHEIPIDVINIAAETVKTKPQKSTTLVANDGAVGDPASLGVAVLLANWTQSDISDTSYARAAGQQLDYLLHTAPKTDTGAISHRADQVQLWHVSLFADDDGGPALLQTAYDQCRLYRDHLRDENGLWRHIALGSWQDDSHWATGNGWAAAGMLRVLETISYSTHASKFVNQRNHLKNWIQEIIDAVWVYQ